jgi:hypothetical protein
MAGLSFWIGGRVLHEFAKFDRMFGEMAGIVIAFVLGSVAFLLRGMAERVEDPDDGEPVGLAISEANENEKTG